MKSNKVYTSIIKGLNEAVDHEKGINVKGLKRKKVSISPLPHYTSIKIKEIRNRLNLSQPTFAKILGVSIKTIEAWESGKNIPQGPAQRMLSLLEKDNNLLEKYKIIVS
ncbi:MAG TPA: helix-turn-helix domain-containing protein [Spirochaetota bacterium]|nr:helix-turn-helix domain-containing protein [Spirochaetota bacterium]HPQ55278.1 helix-turn-helix domain-containing protein [Spirochaetota bacterium]